MVAVKSLDRCNAVDLKPTLLHSAESEQLDDEGETKSLKFLFTKMDLDVGSSPPPPPERWIEIMLSMSWQRMIERESGFKTLRLRRLSRIVQFLWTIVLRQFLRWGLEIASTNQF